MTSHNSNQSVSWWSRLASSQASRPTTAKLQSAIVENLEARQLLSSTTTRVVGGDDVEFAPIVGGTDAEVGEYPYVVSIQNAFGFHTCGGTLIAPNWVLTAAHCQVQVGEQIVAGLQDLRDTSGAETRTVAEVITHPDYDAFTFDNDIALVRLSEPFDFTSSIVEIPFATEADMAFFEPGDTGTIVGWGATFENGPASNQLQEAEVPIVSIDEANAPGAYDGEITENMLPAGRPDGGTDTSQGDSGGPLLVRDGNGRFIVAGITSFGFGSARPGFPGIYTRVANYENFIRTTIDSRTDASTISGTVFEDLDLDGTQGSQESGVPNQTVFIDTNGDGEFQDTITAGQTFSSFDVPLQVPDDGSVVFSTLDVAGVQSVNNLSVAIDILHPSTGDLIFGIQSPTGQFVTLSSFNGGGGNNYVGTVFEDSATQSIASAQAPFTGSFSPETPLSVFDGFDPTGTWQLVIADFSPVNQGQVINWSLTFGGSLLPEPSTTTDANGNYSFAGLLPGTYNVGLDNTPGDFLSGTPGTFQQTVAVGANGSNSNVDFGVVRRTESKAIIGFNNTNGNLILSESNGSTLVTSSHGSFVRGDIFGDTVRFGDFNGDGLDDAVAQGLNGQWIVKLATEDNGLGSDQQFGAIGMIGNTLTGVDVGDFNGDGMADVIARNSGTGTFLVWYSSGNNFSAPEDLGVSPAGNNVRNQLLGDINGDGVTDVVFQSSDDGVFYTARVDSAGDFKFRSAGRWNESVRLDNVMLGDFNGDNMDDLVFRVFRTGRVWLGESNGARFTIQPTVQLGRNAEFDGVMVGDFDGDGIDGIVARDVEAGELRLLTANAARDGFDMNVAGLLQGEIERFAVLDIDFDGRDDLVARRIRKAGTAAADGVWFAWMSDGSNLTKDTRVLTRWSARANWTTYDTIDSTNVVLPVGGGTPIDPVDTNPGGGGGAGGGDDDSGDDGLDDFLRSRSGSALLGDLI